eukprot:SAG11_NODE_116_length_16002_cov_19.164560_19_plen_70_part_00
MACIWAYPHVYSGFSRTYKNFEKKLPKILRAAGWGGTTVRILYNKLVVIAFYHRFFKIYCKMIPFTILP